MEVFSVLQDVVLSKGRSGPVEDGKSGRISGQIKPRDE